jgi:SAM-dependent methyltransferase
MNRKEKLIAGLRLADSFGVEIGPLSRPILTKKEANIIYVDYAHADALRSHYVDDPAVDVRKIVETDVIWGAQTLSAGIGRKVDFVIASHVIEHVPDLVAWLEEVRSVLKPAGEVRLAVPDRRFTFDYLRRETCLSDVLAAYLIRARVPQPHAILDQHLNLAEIDSLAAWNGDLDPDKIQRPSNFEPVMKMARDVLVNGTYYDTHCWVFTPRSFAALFEQMAAVGLLHLSCEGFHDTARNRVEFFVRLVPCDDQNHIIESWRRMKDAVREHGTNAPDSRRRTGPEAALRRIVALRNSVYRRVARSLRSLSRSFRGR